MQETRDEEPYPARFVMHHPFRGSVACEAGGRYTAGLAKRSREEARNLTELTDWSYDHIARQMAEAGETPP